MSEQLKSLRTLQQMICIAAAAVLAFAMIPDRSREYRAALDELEILRKVPLAGYPTYVQDKFQQQQRANYELLIKVARKADLRPQGKPVFSEAIVMDVPPQGTDIRLRDFDDFISGRHLAGIFLIDRDEPALTARITAALANMDKAVTLNGIAVAGSGSLTIWPNDVRVLDPVVITNGATNLQTVDFYLSSPVPPAPAIHFPVTCTFQRSNNQQLALEWVLSGELGRKLVDPKSRVVFPHLKPFGERIGNMGIDNAALFLQERIESTTRGTLTFFGISVDRVLVLWVGPAVLFSLMLFFWLHMRYANASLYNESSTGGSAEYPWIICFPDWISGIVGYGSIIAFPVAASVLLLVNHGEWREWSTRGGAALAVAMFFCGVLAGWEIHTFRVKVKKQRNETAMTSNLLDVLAKPL